ncbi:PD-(D/E)XK nuclease family protein [Weeksellaceae bacterium TAE3-ERU29]|nr:PD-(D/E)XK nuclease family protein [Weeksellaceae bacterium TAE3-ERU29]
MKELIEKIKILNRYQKQIDKLTNDNFNIFKICGVNHYEVTHSSILAELLSNKGSHNFETKFLKLFLDTLKQDNIIESDFVFSLSDIEVTTEFSIGLGGRIDIIVKNRDQCIIIENKIYARDQFEQLKRYEEYAKRNFKSYQLLYLNLWGDEASEQSSKGVDYKVVSYEHTIVNWLEKCIEISARKPIIRETLIQYVNHIKYLTNNTQLSQMNTEIIELLSKEENIEALFTISDNIDKVRNHLINKVLIPQLDRVCNELNLKNESGEYDRVNTPWSQFVFLNPNWKYYNIALEFENKNLRNLIIGLYHRDKEKRNDKTFSVLKDKFNKSNENWVWNSFPVPYDSYWRKEAMIAIINGEMCKLFESEIKKILEITKGLDM